MKRIPAGSIVVALALSCLGLARPAAAQTTPKAEVSGGYQWAHFSSDGHSESFNNGWFADVAANVKPHLSLVFQASGSYKTVTETTSVGAAILTASANLSAHQYLGGIRVNGRASKKVTPFAQFLVGAAMLSAGGTASGFFGDETHATTADGQSKTHTALQVGGGLNLMMSKTVGVRGIADYGRIFNGDSGFNVFRTGIGVVFAF
jgi:hypothetical protein